MSIINYFNNLSNNFQIQSPMKEIMYMHNLKLYITHCKSHVETKIMLYFSPKKTVYYISRVVQYDKLNIV